MTRFSVDQEVRILPASGMPGAGGLGTVVRAGVKTPFSNDCLAVRRHDGTGTGLYLDRDLAPATQPRGKRKLP